MFQLVLIPNHTGATACMYYNTQESAEAAYQNVHEQQRKGDVMLNLKDDHGFKLTMAVNNLSYALLIDCVKSAALHNGPSPDRPKLHVATH